MVEHCGRHDNNCELIYCLLDRGIRHIQCAECIAQTWPSLIDVGIDFGLFVYSYIRTFVELVGRPSPQCRE